MVLYCTVMKMKKERRERGVERLRILFLFRDIGLYQINHRQSRIVHKSQGPYSLLQAIWNTIKKFMNVDVIF